MHSRGSELPRVFLAIIDPFLIYTTLEVYLQSSTTLSSKEPMKVVGKYWTFVADYSWVSWNLSEYVSVSSKPGDYQEVRVFLHHRIFSQKEPSKIP